jgi:transcriptional regulator with XRE-family HTH domain
VHEDLLNAAYNLVHRHVLRELHHMTGVMLEQLEVGTDLERYNFASPSPNGETGAGPTVATARSTVKLSPKPSTVERRRRLQRAKVRAANGVNIHAAAAAKSAKVPPSAPAPAADAWPEVRTQFLAETKRRSLSRDQVGAELGVSKSSICGWLSPRGGTPSAGNLFAIRRWLSAEPPPPPLDPGAEWPQLRQQLKDAIAARGLTQEQIAAAVKAEPRTVATWLTSDERGPRLRVSAS